MAVKFETADLNKTCWFVFGIPPYVARSIKLQRLTILKSKVL